MGKDAKVERPSWDLDTALRHIGPVGRWQIGVFLLNGLMYASLGFPTMFVVDTPDYHCKIPVNATKNATIPKVLHNGELVDDKCNVYVNYSYTNATMPCTDGWEFDKNSGYISTVVTDFQLTCDKNILVEISMMISSGTRAVFQLFTNKLADAIGRKTVFIGACVLRLLFGTAVAFSPNMVTYTVLNACLAATGVGFAPMIILLNLELFPTSHRSDVSTATEFFWLVSIMRDSLAVYMLRDWRVLWLVLHTPIVIGIAYIWLIPESMPWLISKGRYKEVQKILERGARINKRPLPPGFFDKSNEKKPLCEDSDSESATPLNERMTSRDSDKCGSAAITQIDEKRHQENGQENDVTDVTFSDVFKSPRMRIITLILFLLWFTNSIIYNALTYTVTYLSGDRYLNFFYYNLAEIPAVIVFYISVNRFGHRLPISILHVTGGVALLLTMIVIHYDVPSFVIAMNFIGKFGVTASYCAILLFTPELYPTSVRSVFYGMCVFCDFLAVMIAPYCRPLELAIPGDVRGICGALSFLVGLLVLYLPETFRRPLPTSIKQVENWSRNLSEEEIKRYYELREDAKKNDIPMDTVL